MAVSRKQSLISYSIIILLFFIAVAVGIKQQHYGSASDDTVLKDSLFGDKFLPAGDIEHYMPANLYEKINGKADLYLDNGFVSLQSRRFADKSASDKWAEVYIYDMANNENAFAIYSVQKRSESTPLDSVQFGYSTSDAFYAAASQYYIEVALSADDTDLFNSTMTAVKNLISTISTGKTEIPFLNLFPKENLNIETFKFISADAFGSDLKNIFAAEYTINGNNVTAYLTKDPKGEAYKNYHRFLVDNGGTELQLDIKQAECKAVELFGTTDIIFKSGDYFAGVRGSAPINDLKQITLNLIENLKKH
ncbi:MAG: hypothetical protein A2Y10_01840 [Planctomycetes bacterium GWF2_41_51]|nr:MAG: hypothetical protein A2Y10_01840 [Planctomycetes bacterium GWF2_41_51]HBG26319.1 hypothetical protein [Phycisphaerales bacterium]